MRTAHLNALRALEAVLRLGTFRAAADALGVTPAAVGQQIRALEEVIGRPLFARNPTGVAPTEEAQRIAPRLTAGLSSLSDVLEELTSASRRQRVSVSMTQALAESWLPGELPGFFARCREVDLRFDTSHLPVDLLEGSFDFALRYGPVPDEGFDCVALFPGLVSPVCTADFARRYGLDAEKPSVQGVPLCHVEDHTTDPEWVDWPGWCARFAVEGPASMPRFSRFASGLRVAQSGLGLVIGGIVESYPALRDGSLVLPFGPQSVLRCAYLYRLIWVKERRLSPVQRTFRDWIVERAEAHREAIAALLGAAGPDLVSIGTQG